MKKVLILGGGFAGVEAAIFLRKENFEVTLISNRDYFYIYPTSIWIPTGESKFEDICVPLKDLQKAHGFELIIDDVESIKSKESKVYCKNDTYEYEFLIVAMGSGKMKHDGS
jgi:sulfide:quinone oxidoreductase